MNARAELILADGRTLQLAGIDTPQATQTHFWAAEFARRALTNWLAGHAVTIKPVSGVPDRWGRIAAQVFASGDFSEPAEAPLLSAALVLLDAGLARARPMGAMHECVGNYLSAEESARRAGLGLWGDSYYAVVEASDDQALATRAGRFVVAEGRVTKIGHGRTRIFVNFGRSRDSLTVVFAKRDTTKFVRAGFSPEILEGARLRVRGILDTRFGPRIEVANPDQFEKL